MATIKSYTNIEQSKKLAKILPFESADMCYPLPCKDGDKPLLEQGGLGSTPCWSLAALFKVIPNCIEGAEPSFIKTFRNDYRIVYDIYGDENITSEDYTNPVDACVEMIISLRKLNLL